MTLQKKIHELSQEWAEAGDDVPLYLQVIRELVNRLAALETAMEDRGMINWNQGIQNRAEIARDFTKEFDN